MICKCGHRHRGKDECPGCKCGHLEEYEKNMKWVNVETLKNKSVKY